MFNQIKIDAPYLFDGDEGYGNKLASEITKTASFTVSVNDKFKTYIINSASAITVTVPTSLQAGIWWELISINTGIVTVSAASGVNVYSADTRLKLRTKYSHARLTSRGSSNYFLTGDITV